MVGDELQVKLLNREGGAWIVDSGVTGLKRARLCGVAARVECVVGSPR